MTTRFIDEGLPDIIVGYPCVSSARWSTDIQQVDSGAERANQRWENPLRTFLLPDSVREQAAFETIYNHWLAMRGPLQTFPFKDPLDFASAALSTPNEAPTLSRLDQSIGTGDGVKNTFQLTKTYSAGAQSYTRNIVHPVVSTVLIGVAGIDPTTASPTLTWTVSRTTGLVTFDFAPANGAAITAGYLYDVEVRFGSDNAFDGIVKTFGVSGYADIEFIEVRCL